MAANLLRNYNIYPRHHRTRRRWKFEIMTTLQKILELKDLYKLGARMRHSYLLRCATRARVCVSSDIFRAFICLFILVKAFVGTCIFHLHVSAIHRTELCTLNTHSLVTWESDESCQSNATICFSNSIPSSYTGSIASKRIMLQFHTYETTKSYCQKSNHFASICIQEHF